MSVNIINRNSFVQVIILAMILFLPDQIIGQGLSVSPSRIFFRGAPGEMVAHTITFSNHSESGFQFIPHIKDWDRDSLGVKKYYPAGTFQESNGDWLRMSDHLIQLSPGEVKEMTLYMNIPDENLAEQLTHSMLFFTQLKDTSSDPEGRGVGLNVLLEIGVQIYHVPSGLKEGEIEFLDFRDEGVIQKGTTKHRKIGVKIQNHSSLNKDAKVRFEMTNKETGKEVPLQSVPVAMLPFATQWIFRTLPADLRGEFLVIAILDEGDQFDLKIAEKEILY